MERNRLELGVGFFLLLGLICLAYVSIKLGNVQIFKSSEYKVYATFSTAGGLKPNADVTMAGVRIGHVENVELKDGQALVILSIKNNVRLEDDVIATIKTMGIIGDKYVAISAGASDNYIKPGGAIQETQPPLDLEKLIGKFVFGSVDKEKSEKPGKSGDTDLLDNSGDSLGGAEKGKSEKTDKSDSAQPSEKSGDNLEKGKDSGNAPATGEPATTEQKDQ